MTTNYDPIAEQYKRSKQQSPITYTAGDPIERLQLRSSILHWELEETRGVA